MSIMSSISSHSSITIHGILESDFFDTTSTSVDSIVSITSDDFVETSESTPIQLLPRLPSFLHRYRRQTLSEENKDTFVQTIDSCRQSVKHWPPSIRYVRDEFITFDLCKLAVSTHDGDISHIKQHLLTENEYYTLCMESVEEYGDNLKDIPCTVQTQELCDAAIKSDCWTIQYCKDEFKTPINCFSAVRRNGQTIQFAPRNFIDEAMCKAAVQSGWPCLEFIPKEFITLDLCTIAVKSDGRNLEHVPDEFMSSELGFLAITSPGRCNSLSTSSENIKFIPKKYLTTKMIIESVKYYSWTFTLIPKECINDALEADILDMSPYCIQYVDQTYEKCMRAVKRNPEVIECIQKKYITPDMIDYILSIEDKIKDTEGEGTVKYIKSFFPA